MHEIEPQSDPRLTAALHRLAACSERSAPAALGMGLLAEFRRHHARRRKIRAVIGTTTLCLCLVIAIASLRLSRNTVAERHAKNTTSEPSLSLQASAPQQKTVSPGNVTAPGIQASGRRTTAHGVNTGRHHRVFLALPDYDPAVPMDQLNVVRVRLPVSALWKMGAPVPADAGARPVMADFVVSQDGTPFAVRLVQ